MMTSVEAVEVELTIVQGQDLPAKDRNVFGKRTTSDPFIEIHCQGRKVGKTRVIPKTVSPMWNQTFQWTVPTKRGGNSTEILLRIFDHDTVTAPDAMGVVKIPVPTTTQASTGPQWYDVEPGSAKNATGRVQVALQTRVHKSYALHRGNVFELSQHNIVVGLAWDLIGGRQAIDLDVSCVALSRQGQVLMSESVYYGNLSNTNSSIAHSGDEKEGDEIGDDERLTLALDKIPSSILALYLVLTVATPGKTLADVRSARVTVTTEDTHHRGTTLCSFTPASNIGNSGHDSTAMFLLRIARGVNEDGVVDNSNKWMLSPIEDTHPTARDFGSLIPYLKGYMRDLVSSLEIDPTERVAVMRKGGTIRVRDYCTEGKVPDWVTFGLSWDVTSGVNIDLDASAVLLDENLALVDQVWFRQLQSKEGAIRHGGDEREGDEVGDDEKIFLNLSTINPSVKYIGTVINSYSGQELDDVHRASCHLFDQQHEVDIATHALSNCKSLDGYTALVMGCLYRDRSQNWCLRIISEAAHGRTVNDNVDELQNFLRSHPPQPPIMIEEEIVVDSEMPAFVPIEDDEIILDDMRV